MSAAAATALTPAPVEYEVVETLLLGGRRWVRGERIPSGEFMPGRAEALLRMGRLRDPGDVRRYRARRPFRADGVDYQPGDLLPPEASGWRSLQVMLRTGQVVEATAELAAPAPKVATSSRRKPAPKRSAPSKGKRKASPKRAR